MRACGVRRVRTRKVAQGRVEGHRIGARNRAWAGRVAQPITQGPVL